MKKKVSISDVFLYFSYLAAAGVGLMACLAIGGLFYNLVNSILQ